MSKETVPYVVIGMPVRTSPDDPIPEPRIIHYGRASSVPELGFRCTEELYRECENGRPLNEIDFSRYGRRGRLVGVPGREVEED